ncbi:MAG: hypothetical protein ACRD15_07200 [Vicinamibacterales bacterium]
MKALLISTAVVVIAALSFAVRATGTQTPPGELWQVDRCYRVYPHDRDQFYGFRVLEPPKGQWVRAQPDPAPMQGPGMRPPAPFWLNADSLFGVQEWPCSER